VFVLFDYCLPLSRFFRFDNVFVVLFIHTVNQYSSTAIVSIDNIRTFPANMNLLIVALETSRKANLWPV
jgi:hypothetical protein